MTRLAVGLGVAAALASCGKRAGPEPGAEPAGAPAPVTSAAAPADHAAATILDACERLPFAATLPIPEASGAVWLPRDGGVIVVVSDSGHRGEYVEIAAADGRVLDHGHLPLDGRGDDLEGLAADGDRLWAIDSSGWMRTWRRKSGGGYALAGSAFPIDDDDECGAGDFNCGRNYEGLCLGGAETNGCGGYAVAKADGELVCLVRDGDRWLADRARSIAVTGAGVMAACDITADGAVWTGDNFFGASTVRRLVGGKVTASAHLGDGFPEAMAIAADGTIFRFSDVGGTGPSRAARYRCGPKGASPEAAR